VGIAGYCVVISFYCIACYQQSVQRTLAFSCVSASVGLQTQGRFRLSFSIMPHAQTWALSQTANKSSGECSECHEIRQLHIKDGTVHRHGPRSKPCAGSGKPPFQGNDLTSSQSNIDTSTAGIATSAHRADECKC
jgi:hypothetical protein